MTEKRIDSIDFWRGTVLAIIFINHIPGNILGNFTPRNYGFSDAAEAFVFISGLSVVLAYGRRFQMGSALEASTLLTMRAVRLYAVHIVLTASALSLFAVATILTGQDAFLNEHGRSTPFADPIRGAVGIMTLGHQIGYFNILPLYVTLLAFAPALCLLGARDRWRMLLLSAGIYALARSTGVNLPSWPDPGDWFFNPIAWQFMFALGIFVGLSMRKGGIPVHAGIYRLALIFTCASAIVVSNVFGFVPGLADAAGAYLDWGKTELGVIRIVDFLALAYALYCSGLSARFKSTPIYSAASLLGRHALMIFCVGSLLSAIGQILSATWESSALFDVAFVAVGLGILYKIASVLECRRRTEAILASAPKPIFSSRRRAFLRSAIVACVTPWPTLAIGQAARNRCASTPIRIQATGALRRTAARFAARKPVRILAIGSSSTQGVGASSPAFAYPARLESALERRFPGVDVRVVNAGIAGETADRTLARLDSELEQTKPDLVLWQVGTNDALTASVSEPNFESVVERGVASIERHKSDIVLVDQQFIKKVKDPARYERFVTILERIAREERICLFPRYRLMKVWDATEKGGIESMLATDGLHMNDTGYGCVADLLATHIEAVIAMPDQ